MNVFETCIKRQEKIDSIVYKKTGKNRFNS